MLYLKRGDFMNFDMYDYLYEKKDLKNDYIYNNDKKIYNDNINKFNLNKLGNYELSNTMEYTLYLYILYCNKFGYNPSNVVNYIISNSLNNSNILFNADKDFKKWVLINYGIKDAYIKHLEMMGIDLSDSDVIELYKGKLDSVAPAGNAISPYCETMNAQNSILYKRNGKIYMICEESVKELREGKTYIIQNPYSVASLLYLLETLGNTNNRIIVSFWGSLNDRNIKKTLSMMSEVVDYLNANQDGKIETKFEEKDGIYTYSFIIDAKSIKKEVDLAGLITKRDLELLDNTYLSSYRKGK